MAAVARQDVLSQKASAARRALEARSMSPAKALRRALSRTADVLWDLALVTHGIDLSVVEQENLVTVLPADTLLLLLDGPEGVLGIAAVDRQVMTGLIEVQTILQVTQMPLDDRPLTQTDAAMMAPLIDGALDRFVRYLEDHPLRSRFEGFRFGAMIDDARSAALLLDAPEYQMLRVSVDLALGRRRGELLLLFPEPGLAEESAAAPVPDAPGPYEQRMKLLPARMEAVLCRIRLTLRAAQALQPGDLLLLPRDALDGAEFYAGKGDAVAGGRLGQMNGMRAIRLRWPAGLPRDAAAMSADPDPVTEAPVMAPMAAAPLPAPPVEDLAADLPDLPAMEFDSGEFDFSAAMGGEDLGDFDFSAAPMEEDG
ncbi:FliM/FliN family flagellar motor C-terminal domain-containing protein [Salipiger marinus]|jgi:flagellar motor switch protein FliM|uniref:FliM/FliN family flagellar motor C-terminal domain-containing protein n=1 Tax=Salipiger marinus TaxID=555512 RepID=UPI0040587A6C